MTGEWVEAGLTKEEAWKLAEEWVSAWNAHDLERILTHYDDAVELVSPVASQLTDDAVVRGKQNLRAYFARGLETFPHLTFTLHDVCWAAESVVLYYTNHRGTRTAEVME